MYWYLFQSIQQCKLCLWLLAKMQDTFCVQTQRKYLLPPSISVFYLHLFYCVKSTIHMPFSLLQNRAAVLRNNTNLLYLNYLDHISLKYKSKITVKWQAGKFSCSWFLLQLKVAVSCLYLFFLLMYIFNYQNHRIIQLGKDHQDP